MATRLRPETPADADAIRALTQRAFAGRPYASGTEAALVDALRAAGALTLSLVAEDGVQILGHIAFSPAVGEPGWFALGPISEEPAHQRQGIGTALIQAGLTDLAAQGARGCILVGDTTYYSRHGFQPRPDLAPPDQPAEYFMIQAFAADPATRLDFHPIFHEAGA